MDRDLICNFSISVAARNIVLADLSLRHFWLFERRHKAATIQPTNQPTNQTGKQTMRQTIRVRKKQKGTVCFVTLAK